MILIVTLNPCIDKTVYVEKNEIGKIINAYNVKVIAGGKGNNVARVLNNLNIPNISLNILGGYYGKIIEERLIKESINYEAVWIKGSSRTVTTILEKNLRQTAFAERGPGVSSEEISNIMNVYNDIINTMRSSIKFVVLSGSVPSENCINLYNEMIKIAKDKKIKTVLDSRGEALKKGLEAKPFLIKPNLKELMEIMDISDGSRLLEDNNRIIGYLKKLKAYSEIAIVTMGSDGAILSYREEIYKAKVPAIEVVNPIGSGDSFIAGFIYGLINELPVKECFKIAVAAGTANASIWDAAHCSKNQIMDHMGSVDILKLS